MQGGVVELEDCLFLGNEGGALLLLVSVDGTFGLYSGAVVICGTDFERNEVVDGFGFRFGTSAMPSGLTSG